jgi:putative Holliday junction resolvase
MMSAKTRWLGIDPGKVRLGLAVSDADGRLASPLATYRRRDPDQDAHYFAEVIAREEIGRIVVGLPVHLDGREGEQAAAARALGRWLEKNTGLPVIFWDERFTSHEAETALLSAGLTRKKRKARRDRVAAQVLLQSFLDAGCPSEQVPGPLG